MGWIKQTEKPCSHPNRPKLPAYRDMSNQYMCGDIWECDHCKRQFTVEASTDTKYDQREGSYHVQTFTWREM